MNDQPQKSSPLKYVAIGYRVLILLDVCAFDGCMVMGGAGAMGAMGAVAAPAEQTKGFFADLRARNHAGAFARMGPAYQASHTLQTFQQNVDAMPALTQQTEDTINNRSVMNGTATMSGTLTTPQGDIPIEATLNENGAIWQIDALVVGGVALP